MLRLRVKAPFGAFRHFTAGSYRPTAPCITPSAAYGLLMNLAGIETRWDDGRSAMTLTRAGLPRVKMALGQVACPEVHSIYQQLHNYPVGASGKDRAGDCKGNKYNIQPVRREFLSGIDFLVCVRETGEVEQRIRSVLRGEPPEAGFRRYGLPFLRDNGFLIDTVVEERIPQTAAHWLTPAPGVVGSLPQARMRLTVSINRTDMTQTRSNLFLLLQEPLLEPILQSWITVEAS